VSGTPFLFLFSVPAKRCAWPFGLGWKQKSNEKEKKEVCEEASMENYVQAFGPHAGRTLPHTGSATKTLTLCASRCVTFLSPFLGLAVWTYRPGQWKGKRKV